MSTAAWDIYAEQLISLGYGYPLWVPDPAPGQAPIQIGDVGWVHEGEFHVLFNALREAHDAQPMNAVPANFAPLNPKGLQIWGPREKIWQRVLCSRTIHRRDISGGVSVNGPAPSGTSGNVDFTFRCSGDSGAFLMVNPCAMTHDILSNRAVSNYMDANFDNWLSFANDTAGLDIREDDIRFVMGTTTTAQWAVAAFRSSCRNKQGTLTCSLAGTGTASFSMSISDEALPTSHYRVGPPRLQPTHPSSHTLPAVMSSDSTPSSAPAEMIYDQCIFVHTLKRKKRLEKFLRFLKAGAGPDELPRNPDGTDFEPQLLASANDVQFEEGDAWDMTGLSSQVEYVTEFPRIEAKDPVDILLDYILEHSSARTAVASEKDLYMLFASQHAEWLDPEDLKKTLDKIPVTIHVDSNGAGSVQIPLDAKARRNLKFALGNDMLYDEGEAAKNVNVCPLHDIVCAKGTCPLYERMLDERQNKEPDRWQRDLEKARQKRMVRFAKKTRKKLAASASEIASSGSSRTAASPTTLPYKHPDMYLPPSSSARKTPTRAMPVALLPDTPSPPFPSSIRPPPPYADSVWAEPLHRQRILPFVGPTPPPADSIPTPTPSRFGSEADGMHSGGSRRRFRSDALRRAEALPSKNLRETTTPALPIFDLKLPRSDWSKEASISAPSVKWNGKDRRVPAIGVVEDESAAARPERAWGSWSMETPSLTSDHGSTPSAAGSDDGKWGESPSVAAPGRPGIRGVRKLEEVPEEIRSPSTFRSPVADDDEEYENSSWGYA